MHGPMNVKKKLGKKVYSIMLYTQNAMAFFAVIKLTVVGLQMKFQEYTQFTGQKEKN
jgi:hypothetical protein